MVHDYIVHNLYNSDLFKYLNYTSSQYRTSYLLSESICIISYSNLCKEIFKCMSFILLVNLCVLLSTYSNSLYSINFFSTKTTAHNFVFWQRIFFFRHLSFIIIEHLNYLLTIHVNKLCTHSINLTEWASAVRDIPYDYTYNYLHFYYINLKFL